MEAELRKQVSARGQCERTITSTFNLVSKTPTNQYKHARRYEHMSVVDGNSTLSDCDKLYYLTTFLKGEALNVIKHLPLTHENHQTALALLKDRFDNKMALVSHHVSAILDIDTIIKPNAASLRTVVSQVRQQIGALGNLKQPTEQWDALLICLLQRKLDFYTVRAFYLERNDKNNMPTLTSLLAFLESRAVALETAAPKEERRRSSLVCGVASASASLKKKKQHRNIQSGTKKHTRVPRGSHNWFSIITNIWGDRPERWHARSLPVKKKAVLKVDDEAF
ncbi:hypothetical protein ABMA27_003409 [Loxostege sticticalis]|uniref:Uncharacterized protein n=1 Tax=Loxostege sticticalis TaxID=481309 RepID=A0ABR3HT70_LOXSC